MSDVLLISGSPRTGGNSDLLCSQFAKGAEEAGNTVEVIRLSQKRIGFCRACYACKEGRCPIDDDVPYIIDRMFEADVIVMATPVYFYSIDA